MPLLSIVTALAWNGGIGADALKRARYPHEVSGPCLSACALSWSINPRGCWRPGALLGFHAARDPGTKAIMPVATEWWRQKLPPKIRANVQLGPGLMYLTSEDLARIVPERRCK